MDMKSIFYGYLRESTVREETLRCRGGWSVTWQSNGLHSTLHRVGQPRSTQTYRYLAVTSNTVRTRSNGCLVETSKGTNRDSVFPNYRARRKGLEEPVDQGRCKLVTLRGSLLLFVFVPSSVPQRGEIRNRVHYRGTPIQRRH